MIEQPPLKRRPIADWIEEKTGENYIDQRIWAAVFAGVAVLWWDPLNVFTKDGPTRHEVQCEQAPPGEGNTLPLGKNAVDLSVTMNGVAPLQMGRFEVNGKNITVSDGLHPPEILSGSRIVDFAIADKALAVITVTAVPRGVKVECDPADEESVE